MATAAAHQMAGLTHPPPLPRRLQPHNQPQYQYQYHPWPENMTRTQRLVLFCITLGLFLAYVYLEHVIPHFAVARVKVPVKVPVLTPPSPRFEHYAGNVYRLRPDIAAVRSAQQRHYNREILIW
ncbi:hypothetical protein F5Y17DRAFT_454119 [Xylariaceae sp. FL0594]|nr:hypothetical protein F5Y17DRAFT_454119 [Xylariaceae sp. FL0594]